MLDYKGFSRLFHLRIYGKTKRIRKKNHNRLLRYLNKYGCITNDYK